MSDYYFRFYLAHSPLDEEATVRNHQSILNDHKEPGLIRASFNLIGSEKSISILCQSEEDVITEQRNWANFLRKSEIYITEQMEHEVLQDEERPTPHCLHDHDCHHEHHEHESHHENHWLKAALGTASGIGLLLLSLASFNIPIIAYSLITGLSTLMTLYLGHRVYQSAWIALRQREWSTSTLYTISTLAIVGISIVGLFVPGLPMMLESAPLVLGFWHLGEAIEHTLLDKINEKLDVRDCAPQSVLLKGDSGREVSVKQLIPNDIITFIEGEVIPVDGTLTQPALLYTTRVDGSAFPKQFNSGDNVMAGMCLADHIPMFEMRVTKTYQNSYLSIMAKNINKANDEKAPIELFANQILKYFVPGLLAISVLSGVAIGVLFSPALAIQCVISILVSACPCALSLITPMAVKIGMGKGSEKGVHYKNGKALQAAAEIDAVVFDLNGTLTQGIVSVEGLNIDDEKLLKFIASVGRNSNHPVATTINAYIGIAPDDLLEVTDVDKSHHSGIRGIINGETFMVGNKDMLLENNIEPNDGPYDAVKNSIIYMVQGSKVIGQIALTDPLRMDAIATVKQLKSMGKQVHICTGADIATAERYAALLDIDSDNICANAVGAAVNLGDVSKRSYIKSLQSKGLKVGMVGDAANDLEAIGSADVGIAVKSSIGGSITEQSAGIVVQQGLLFPIAIAFDVAAKTKQNIFQNLLVSLTYNSVITLVASGLFIALGVVLNPAIGVALMVLESTVVLANLYRLKHQETVSPASNRENELNDEEPVEEASARVDYVLDYRPQAALNRSHAPPVPYASARSVLGFFGYQPNQRQNDEMTGNINSVSFRSP